jgi:hypothetical protein
MAPKGPPGHEEIIELLGRSSEEARQAEAYHAANAAHRTPEGQAAHQAARDAAAMQLIELAGCAEGFGRNRGEPGTTLARLDDALRPVIQMRAAHTHPEIGSPAVTITPRVLREAISDLRNAIGNLDDYTLKTQPPDQGRVLTRLSVGIIRIERDGFPDPARLRPRDLHYAEHYRSIQFGRLAKATELFNNWDKSFPHHDPRYVDINARISTADDMAHKFHEMRGGSDKSILPPSVVAAAHQGGGPGRPLSETIRELRREHQTTEEARDEFNAAETEKAREHRREAVRGLAQDYARITGDPKAAPRIHDYVQRQAPMLTTDAIAGMRAALQVAVDPKGDYPALPATVRNDCLYLCFALEKHGDARLLDILNAADRQQPQANSAGDVGITDSKAAKKTVWPADPEPSIGPGQDGGYKQSH